MNWLLARLRESSSWRGIVWILTFAGVVLTPEQGEAIIAAGMALAGLLGVFLSDAQPAQSVPVPCESGSVSGVETLPEIVLVGRASPGTLADAPAVHSAGAVDDSAARGPADWMRVTVPTPYPAEHDERSGPGWNG